MSRRDVDVTAGQAMDLATQATGDWYSGCGSLEYVTETIVRAGDLAQRALADGPHAVLRRRIGRRNIASRQDVYKRLLKDAALIWHCDACDREIEDGDGWLTVSVLDAITREREWKASDAKRGDWEPVSIPAVLELPAPAPWKVLHRDCDPDLDGQSYWIGVERIRTVSQVFGWSLHLAEKRWFQHTAWDGIIRGHIMAQLDRTGA